MKTCGLHTLEACVLLLTLTYLCLWINLVVFFFVPHSWPLVLCKYFEVPVVAIVWFELHWVRISSDKQACPPSLLTNWPTNTTTVAFRDPFLLGNFQQGLSRRKLSSVWPLSFKPLIWVPFDTKIIAILFILTRKNFFVEKLETNVW